MLLMAELHQIVNTDRLIGTTNIRVQHVFERKSQRKHCPQYEHTFLFDKSPISKVRNVPL